MPKNSNVNKASSDKTEINPSESLLKMEEKVNLQKPSYIKKLRSIIGPLVAIIGLMGGIPGLTAYICLYNMSLPICPFDEPVMDQSDYNILLAGFSYLDSNILKPSEFDQEINQEIGRLEDNIFSELKQYQSLGSNIGLYSHENFRMSSHLGSTLDEQKRQAQNLSLDSRGFNVVIYGYLERTDTGNSLHIFFLPKFDNWIPLNINERTELVNSLEIDRDLFLGIEEKISQDVKRNIDLLQKFTKGIGHYIDMNYEDSLAQFNSIILDRSEISPLIYIYAGNAALASSDWDTALSYFNQAIDRGYTRGYVGRGLAILTPLVQGNYYYDEKLAFALLDQANPSDPTDSQAQTVQKDMCLSTETTISEIISTVEMSEGEILTTNDEDIEYLRQEYIIRSISCLQYYQNLNAGDTNDYISVLANIGIGKGYEWLTRSDSDHLSKAIDAYTTSITDFDRFSQDINVKTLLSPSISTAYSGRALLYMLQGEATTNSADKVNFFTDAREDFIKALELLEDQGKIADSRKSGYCNSIRDLDTFLNSSTLDISCN